MQIVHSFLDGSDACAKVHTFEATGYLHQALQILPADFRLSGIMLMAAKEPSVAVRPVELVNKALLISSSEERFCSGKRTRMV